MFSMVNTKTTQMNPYHRELQNTVKALMAEGKEILQIEYNDIGDRRFEELGIGATAANRQDYRALILTAPNLDTRVGIVNGIQVDIGSKVFASAGLDGLAARVSEYYRLGARFAKWRAVINIGADLPSMAWIEATALALAQSAAICQRHGLVPIIEPFVSGDGNHTIDRCQEVTAATLKEVFKQLTTQGVAFDRLILNPSLVTTGLSAALPAPVNEIAMATMETLMQEVPSTVAGIAFSFEGQTTEQACAYRKAIDILSRQAPWAVTFFDAPAIHRSALEHLSVTQNSLTRRGAGDNIIYIIDRVGVASPAENRQLAAI
jgi:fructose-bisphosphate aldolase, class I